MTSLRENSAPDRRPSPLLSNNPFRNASSATSPPSATSSAFPNLSSNTQVLRNPFADSAENSPSASAPSKPLPSMMTSSRSAATDTTRELFGNLRLENQRPRPPPPPPYTESNGQKLRTENIPPRTKGKIVVGDHRPVQSDEERHRAAARLRAPQGDVNIFADPPDPNKIRERRPRGNSDTSANRTSKLQDPDEDKRRRERRHKDREARRHGKPKQSSRRLDLIDKLDVTSIYGTGLFHHDGPFDACNPNRNRKGARAAPMQAFPKDSTNMALGGAGPNHSRLNLSQIHGTGAEAHNDYSNSAVADEIEDPTRRPGAVRSTSFNPTDRVEPVHGEESYGLGTSTFLEGAPASRAAIQRRESENEAATTTHSGGGLSRKKSLAQKFRGHRTEAGLLTPSSPSGQGTNGKSDGNTNPFFVSYDNELERKASQIQFSVDERNGRPRAPSSPRRGLGLERKTTNESFGEEGKSGGGFLSRVRSLKGSRKARA